MLFEHLNVFLTPMYIRKPNTELFVGVHDLDGETTDTNNFFLLNKAYAVAFNIITNKIQNNNSITYDNYDYTNAINKFSVNMKILNQDQYLTNYRDMGIKSNNMQQYEILRIVYSDLNTNLIYKNHSSNTLLIKLQSKVDGTCLNSNIDHKLYFKTCDDYNLDQIFELRDNNNINTSVSHFHIKNYSDSKYLSFSTTGAGIATAVERTVAHFFSYSNNILQDINVTNVNDSDKILTNDNNNIKLISSDIGNKNDTMVTLTKQSLTTYKIIHNNSKTCVEYNPTALSYSLKPCETSDVQLFQIEEFNKNYKFDNKNNIKNVNTGTFVMINDKYVNINTNTGKLELSSSKTNNTLKLDPQLQLNKVLYKNDKNEIVANKSNNENNSKPNEVLGKVYW